MQGFKHAKPAEGLMPQCWSLGLIQGISCLFIESAIGLFQGCSLHAFLLLRKPGQVQRIPAAEIPPPHKARHPHLRL
ncbi:MAG: hypothetical protein EBX65_07835, partial [Betaproteobacteria bacterium]|nr:hypothetical protein [Betaproteobacteria bacterium]